MATLARSWQRVCYDAAQCQGTQKAQPVLCIGLYAAALSACKVMSMRKVRVAKGSALP